MNKNILIGITGSISCYKICDLVWELKEKGFNCFVAMSETSLKFVNKLTFEILTGNKVLTDKSWFESNSVEHINTINNIDCFLVAPATANTISKISCGISDNIISTLAISLKENTKKFFAPSMNTNMYNNIVIQENINKLKKIGYIEIPPCKTLLACGDYGIGGLAKLEDIIEFINKFN
ncbi:flavoprotein [Malacoplasma iowae]|uniref:flavoprotein n=1 Tax=Malacoplasma iowae TaxID=2116 RepID=UPI003872F82B|nr:flavoprotein [Malacoplasma iowae]